ncbi:MAG: type II toxin-antitoxin system RelE family toxin [Moorellaceae bacterium]
MVFEIIFSPKAIRQMKKLERETQVRIKSAIERSLRSFPPEGDVVKLEGQRDVFRLRVGDWKVTFRYRFDKREVHISEVVHRSKAYQFAMSTGTWRRFHVIGNSNGEIVGLGSRIAGANLGLQLSF